MRSVSKQTAINNLVFRSITEAKWAIFMLNMGIQFKYEPKTYQTSEGLYLPDFYCPEHHAFVEVKGVYPTDVEVAKLKDVIAQENAIGIFLTSWPKREPLSSDRTGNLEVQPVGSQVWLCSPHKAKPLVMSVNEIYDNALNAQSKLDFNGAVNSADESLNGLKHISQCGLEWLVDKDDKYRYALNEIFNEEPVNPIDEQSLWKEFHHHDYNPQLKKALDWYRALSLKHKDDNTIDKTD